MRLGDSRTLKAAAVLAGVVVLTGTLGIAVSAKMGQQGQDPSQGPPPQGTMGPGMGMRGGPGGPGGPLGFLGMAARELNLTDVQRQQIRTIAKSYRNDAAQKNLAAARVALEKAVTADQLDEAAVRTAAAALAPLEADAAVQRAKMFQDVWKILTSDQQLKAQELKSQMEQRMLAGPGRAGRGRGGHGFLHSALHSLMS